MRLGTVPTRELLLQHAVEQGTAAAAHHRVRKDLGAVVENLLPHDVGRALFL